MEISVEVTADDVRAFQVYLARAEPLYAKLRKVFALVISVPLLIYATSIFFLPGTRARMVGAPILVVYLVVVVVYLVVVLALFPYLKGVNRAIAAKATTVLGSHRMVAAADGFWDVSRARTTMVNWHALHRVEMEGDMVFVFLDPMTAFVVPMRSYGPEQRMQFVAAVQHGMAS